MSSTVTNYIQPLTQPLEGLHTSFTQLASQHRDMDDSLRSHKDDLLSNSTFAFQGGGADAFSSLVDYFLDTSEKHMQAFDDAAGAVRTCHSTITTASNNADAAGLHEGLTNHVLSQVSHNDIIQRGSDPIQAVISDMQQTMNDMAGKAGDMFTSLLHFHFGTAFDDLLQEVGDSGRLAGDIWNLLQDIARVLGSWAETVWSAVKNCLPAIETAATNAVKWVAAHWGQIIVPIATASKFITPLSEFLDKIRAGAWLPFAGLLANVLTGQDNTPEKFYSDLNGQLLGFIPIVGDLKLVSAIYSQGFQYLGDAQQNLIAPWLAGNNTTLEKELGQPGSALTRDAQGINLGQVATDIGDALYNGDFLGEKSTVQLGQQLGHDAVKDPHNIPHDLLTGVPQIISSAVTMGENSPAANSGAEWSDMKKAGKDFANTGLSLWQSSVDLEGIGLDDTAVLTGRPQAVPVLNQQVQSLHQLGESAEKWVSSL